MSSSTLILFGTIRLRLLFGSVTVFVIMSLAGVSETDNYTTILLLWVSSFFVALAMKLEPQFTQSIIPITDRQIIFIPIASWFGLFTVGSLGLILGQFIAFAIGDETSIKSIFDFWTNAGKCIPAAIFAALFLFRMLDYRSGAIWVFLPLGMLLFRDDNPLLTVYPLLHFLAIQWWPLWVLFSALMLIEAPQTARVLRQSVKATKGIFTFENESSNQGEPSREILLSRLLDALSKYLLVFTAATLIIINKSEFKPIAHYVIVILCIVVIYVFFENYKVYRASGMTVEQAYRVLIFGTVRWYNGFKIVRVSSGVPIKCDDCRNWKMVWQSHCPHCGDTAARQAGDEWSKFFVYDPEAATFRTIFAVIAVLMLVKYAYASWAGN